MSCDVRLTVARKPHAAAKQPLSIPRYDITNQNQRRNDDDVVVPGRDMSEDIVVQGAEDPPDCRVTVGAVQADPGLKAPPGFKV